MNQESQQNKNIEQAQEYFRRYFTQAASLHNKQSGQGKSGEEALIDKANDRRQKQEDVTQYPFDTICLVGMFIQQIDRQNTKDINDVMYNGTGHIIGERTVLTCAHNCYVKDYDFIWNKVFHYRIDKDKGQIVDQVDCQKQYINQPKYRQHLDKQGMINQQKNSEKKVHLIKQADLLQYRSDYAILKLSKPIVQKKSTEFVALDFTCNSANKDEAAICGFPTKNKKNLANKNPKILLKHSSKYSINVQENKVEYDIDTTAGQSGSSIIITDQNGETKIIGVHILGFSQGQIKRNRGVLLSKENISDITKWFYESETGKNADKMKVQDLIRELQQLGYKILYNPEDMFVKQ